MDKKDQISKWIKKLEQESWQLELLVSGFTIFLLISAHEGLWEYTRQHQFHYSQNGAFSAISIMLLYVILACILVLVVNLVLHLAFRGFWIGAIGLRSVGPTLDFTKLNYHSYFVERLRKNMVSMDDLIVRLDRLCSVIFSFTFLIIFLFLSLFIYLLTLALVSWGLGSLADIAPGWLEAILNVIFAIVVIAYLLGGIIYMLDSLSLGLIKKVGWFRKIYYPVYLFFGTITLSFLYRSIYYNLITKFPKAIIRLVLVAYVLTIIFLPFFEIDYYRYFPDNNTPLTVESDYYDDLRLPNSFIKAASIPTMTVKSDFIPLFIRYDVGDNRAIAQSCPDFEPAKKGGLKNGIDVSDGNLLLKKPEIEEPFPSKALECLADFYILEIDHQNTKAAKVYFYVHPNKEEKGVLMLIDVENLSKGPHTIEVSRQILQDSVLKKTEYANIPFWRN